MGYVFLVFFALLHIKIDCQEVNIYGMQKCNEPAEISCYFQEKDPVNVHWYLNGTKMTRGCNIETTGSGILTRSSHCNDSISGPANYSFIINQLDIFRDNLTGWSCGYAGSPKKLEIPFDGERVTTEKVKTTSTSNRFVRGEEISLTTEIECAYPQSDIIWCFYENNNYGSKLCSDVDDYWEGYFTKSPVITPEYFSCDGLCEPMMKSCRSTFIATALEKSGRKFLKFSVVTNGLIINVATPDGIPTILSFCQLKAGCLAAWAIALIVICIVAVVVGASIGGVYLYKNSKNNQPSNGVNPGNLSNITYPSKSEQSPTGDQREDDNPVELTDTPPGKDTSLPQKNSKNNQPTNGVNPGNLSNTTHPSKSKQSPTGDKR